LDKLAVAKISSSTIAYGWNLPQPFMDLKKKWVVLLQ